MGGVKTPVPGGKWNGGFITIKKIIMKKIIIMKKPDAASGKMKKRERNAGVTCARAGINKEVISVVWEDSGGKEKKKNHRT